MGHSFHLVQAAPMPPALPADSDIHHPYAKAAGQEPLPGYVLIEPLGRGGFGEVWKCVAPGGLHKAIKFVPPTGEGHQLRQELAAFEQIKAIRHPFLLTLERVELINDELVMVMELADYQLAERLRQCTDGGLPGIPRDELLGYLADAAEALDMIAARYGLQHLDVKPANLFLTAGRVKVGDYGLVSRLEGGEEDKDAHRGLTPKYVAPEVLRGAPSQRSDQYSLALVYQELLTGTFPYPARSPQQLMLMHVTATPDLSGLPECDRPAVGRALSKKPEDRFGFCLEFVRALISAAPNAAGSDLAFRSARADRTTADLVITPGPRSQSGAPSSGSTVHRVLAEKTQNVTLPSVAPLTNPGRPLPPLVASRSRVAPPAVTPPPPQPVTPPPVAEKDLPIADAEEVPRVVLDPIRSVVPVVRLLGPHWAEVPLTAQHLIGMVIEAAAPGARVPQLPGDLGMLPDGTWVCRFPSTVPASVAPFKLEVVRGYWGLTVEQPDPLRLVFRKAAPGGLFSRSKGGLDVNVQLPKPGKPVGEVCASGAVYGQPPPDFVRAALDVIPKILTGIRQELGNVPDRRKHPRLAAELPVSVYPIHSDGGIDPAVRGETRDVSVGGLCLAVRASLRTKYVFVAFDSLPQTAGLAIMVQLVRSQNEMTGERIYGCQYRTDL